MAHILSLALAAALVAGRATAALPTTEDSRLVPMFSSDRTWNAVTTTVGGRVFVAYTQSEGPGVQLAELADGKPQPYPDLAMNAPYRDGAAVTGFVHVNSVRMASDGALWVVDAGAPGIGKPAVPGAGRLFRIDLRTNQVTRTYDLSAALVPTSFVDDVRFNGAYAYLTDAGSPALLVLDVRSGAVRRVLDHHPSTTDFRPIPADGKLLTDPAGRPVLIHADQLELSPDGRMLTYMPASGPAARIEAGYLDNAALSPLDVASHVEPWLDTPGTGGTAIDSAGNIYMGDADTRSILRITPSGVVTTILSDRRLVWSDAMWLDAAGFLWVPVPQLNRTAALNGGKAAVEYPVWIYRIAVGATPPRSDHQ